MRRLGLAYLFLFVLLVCLQRNLCFNPPPPDPGHNFDLCWELLVLVIARASCDCAPCVCQIAEVTTTKDEKNQFLVTF